MTTQQFIKEHTFVNLKKILTEKGSLSACYLMFNDQTKAYVLFNGDAEILDYSVIKPTPQEINTIENLIITYLDDLYLSEFEEIKSMM